MVNLRSNRLMLITHPTDCYTELQEVLLFLEGGGRWVQLRQKEGVDLQLACQLSALCHQYHALFCVDDDVRVALAARADGVHLGKQDMPLSEAWELVRAADRTDNFLVGATANTYDDIRRATAAGASYIGLGPYRYTQTKKNLSPILGLIAYQNIFHRAQEEGLHLPPIFAIGGITHDDIPALMKTGIHGIAVSGIIVQSDDPTRETQMLRRLVDNELR